MINLKDFEANTKNPNSLDCIKNIKVFIEKFVKQKKIISKINKFSTLIEIDSSIVELKIKKIISNYYNYKNNRFENFSGKLKIFQDFFIYLYIIFLISFNFKKNKIINTDIILFNVDYFDEIDKFKKVLKNFNSSTIISSRKLDFSDIKRSTSDHYLKENLELKYQNNFLSIKYKDRDNEVKFNTNIKNKKNISFDSSCIKKKFKIIIYSFNLFYYSFKENFNFFKIFNIVLFSYAKNFSIFKKYKSRFMMQDRIYNTCPVRNFLFKKMGGEISTCVQSHLAEASINMFNDTDLFFTFGDEKYSKVFLNELGSRVEASYPVGSLRNEVFYEDSNEAFHSKNKIDILVVGVNLFNWLYVNKNQKENYYDFIRTIKLISLKFPNLNICMKHHPNNRIDPVEKEILKDSQIKYLDPLLNSYTLIMNTGLFISFSSTMILEINAIKGNSFFIDRNQNNNIFFEKNNNLKKIVLSTYDEIEKVVDDIFVKKKEMNNNFNDICLKSDKVSNRIYQKINNHQI